MPHPNRVIKESKTFKSGMELDTYIQLLKSRILDLEKIAKEPDIKFSALDAIREHIVNNLRDIYGQNSPEFEPYEMMRIAPLFVTNGRESEFAKTARKQTDFQNGIERTVAKLNGIIGQLEEKKSLLAASLSPSDDKLARPESTASLSAAKSKKVFIVHGRDNELKQAAARVVEQLGLEAVILHEQPNGGDTVIEKLEKNSAEVGFAIVLLTPDDVGSLNDNGKEPELKPRARQNVILELGFFWGLLGRSNICCIYKQNVDLPSDLHGVVYIAADDVGGWRWTLANNLKHAGYLIDLNKIK